MNKSILKYSYSFLFVILVNNTLWSKEWYYTDFKKIGNNTTIQFGTHSIEKKGLKLQRNSSVKIDIPGGSNIRNGAINLTFTPPKLDMSLLPVLSTPKDCYCAIKIRTGYGEIELSEKWVRVYKYDKSLTSVDSVLFDMNMQMDPSGIESDLTLKIKDKELTLHVNDMKLATVQNYPYNFDNIVITTYKESFLLSELIVEAYVKDDIYINKKNKYIEFTGVYNPSKFNKSRGLKNHHFITWEFGKAGKDALFTSYPSDSQVHQALVKIGAIPGNNLTMETWNKRKSKKSKEPDKRVEGTHIGVKFIHKGKVFTPEEILIDGNKKTFDFRFGGNLSFIPLWQSGCVICLQSCPGSKIGNHTYTIRDLVKKIPDFKIKKDISIKDGNEVTIRFFLE